MRRAKHPSHLGVENAAICLNARFFGTLFHAQNLPPQEITGNSRVEEGGSLNQNTAEQVLVLSLNPRGRKYKDVKAFPFLPHFAAYLPK